MSEIRFSLILDNQAAIAGVQKFFNEFKKKPDDPLKGLDKSFDKVAKQAKQLGFEWDAATKKFKNDNGFSATLEQMKGNLKTTKAAAKESGQSFAQFAATLKKTGSEAKLFAGSFAGADSKLKSTGAAAQGTSQKLDKLGNEAKTVSGELKQLGGGGAAGLTKVGADAVKASQGVDKLGTEAQQTGQQVKALGAGGASGLLKLGQDAQKATGGVDKLGNEALQTGQQLGAIKGTALAKITQDARTAAQGLGTANRAVGPLAQSLQRVGTTSTAVGQVGNALRRAGQAAGASRSAVGTLATSLARAGQQATPLQQLDARFRQMVASIRAAGTAAQKTGNQFDEAAKDGASFSGSIKQGFQQILNGIPTGIGIAIANGITAPLRELTQIIPGAVRAFSDLDEGVRSVLAITGSTADQFGRVADSIRLVGSQSAATNVEVAGIAQALARAGFTLDEIDKSLFAVAQGAEATGTGYAEMGDIVVSALGQFGLAAEDASEAVDLLTQAANSSNQTVGDLGQALKYVGPVANTVGASLKDTATQLALLANAGIRASTAGTSLRTLLTNLAIASGGAGEEFQKLSRGSARLSKTLELIGAEMTDANGELKTGTDLIYALQDSIRGLDSGERAIVSKVLAGSEGLPTLSALVNATGADIEAMADKMNNSLGVAAQAQKTNLSGLSGSFKILQSNISSALSTIGEVIAVGLKPLVDITTAVIAAFNGLPGPIKGTIVVLGLIAAAVVTAKLALAAFSVAAESAFGQKIVAKVSAFAASLKGASIASVIQSMTTAIGAFATTLTASLTAALTAATAKLTAFNAVLTGNSIATVINTVIAALATMAVTLKAKLGAALTAAIAQLKLFTASLNANTIATQLNTLAQNARNFASVLKGKFVGGLNGAKTALVNARNALGKIPAKFKTAAAAAKGAGGGMKGFSAALGTIAPAAKGAGTATAAAGAGATKAVAG
ncbi:MAG: phage tail tape measure protein, partial [Synechococcus sp.]